MIFKLDYALRELDITRNKLAVFAEVRPNTINDLANGTTKRIEIDTIEKILKALNEISMTRGMPRIYNIDDILEYEISSEQINATIRKNAITDEEFRKLHEVFSNRYIRTSIPEFRSTDLRELLIIFSDHLKTHGIQINANLGSDYIQQINDAFRNELDILQLYGIFKYTESSILKLTDKGYEFIRRLKDAPRIL